MLEILNVQINSDGISQYFLQKAFGHQYVTKEYNNKTTKLLDHHHQSSRALFAVIAVNAPYCLAAFTMTTKMVKYSRMVQQPHRLHVCIGL